MMLELWQSQETRFLRFVVDAWYVVTRSSNCLLMTATLSWWSLSTLLSIISQLINHNTFICEKWENYKCCSLFIDQLLLRKILMISLWSMLTRVSQSDYLLHWTLLFSISLSTVRHQHQTISNIQDKLWRSRNKNINHQRNIENTFIWDKLYQGLFTITTWVIY